MKGIQQKIGINRHPGYLRHNRIMLCNKSLTNQNSDEAKSSCNTPKYFLPYWGLSVRIWVISCASSTTPSLQGATSATAIVITNVTIRPTSQELADRFHTNNKILRIGLNGIADWYRNAILLIYLKQMST
jgi:hypothetical protein